MGISFGRDGGLRKTRDITSRSPKEITEVVTFVNRFYPRTVVKDGDWQICQVCSKEHKEDFVIKGTMVAMTNNDEYDTEYKIVARLEWDERREEWGYVVAYSQEIYEFKTVEDQKVFLRQILNDSQLESLFSMYPDPIKAIEEQGVDALIKIPRIGAKTAEKIVGRYDACKDKSKAYVELCKYGLTTNMVDRLVAHYKSPEVAITKVKENPYNLVIDVKGIGFRKADEIAMQLGFSETEPTRCIAFAHHFFQEKANEGDSYVEYDEFLKAVDETLGVDYPDESIDTAMGELNKQEKLWVKDCTDDDGYEYTLIGLKKYYETEKEIAFHLNRLLNRPNSTPIDREEAMKRIKEKEEQQGWKYTERQLEGIFTCMDNNISIIIGYGGCVDCDTEYFNGQEWKRIADYTQGEQVLQYNVDGSANLVEPSRYIKVEADQLFHFATKYGTDQVLSLGHRVVYKTSKGNLKIKPFEEVMKDHNNCKSGFTGKFYTTFNYEGEGIDLTDEEIRVQVAVIADGHFNKDTNWCKMRLKKQRKVERMKQLLDEANIEYTIKFEDKTGFHTISFYAPIREKEFDTYWYNCNRHQFEIVCEEVLYWDGSKAELTKANRNRFTSSSKKTIDFVQFAFATLGKRCSILTDNRKGEPITGNEDYKHKSIYYNINITDRNMVGIGGFHDDQEKTPITLYEEHDGYQYCFKVPSSMLVLRRNGKIFITGNTGKSSAVSGMLACMDEEFVFHQCALSGKASVNLKDITGEEGVTIHSLLGYTPEMNKFMHNEENQLETDLVILDEGSMVDIELALSLLRAIPDHAKLIILGDTNQLEAIGAGNFLLDMIESGQIPLVVFDKVHRQGAKSAIKTESIKVAEGQQLVKRGWTGTEVLGELKDLKYIGFEHPYKSTEKRPSIDLVMTEFKELFKKADTIEDIVVTVPTRSNGTGCYPLNIKIQEYVLPRSRGIGLELGTEKEPFTVYVGDKVINLQNNRKTYYYDKVINEFGEEVVDKVTRPIYNGNVGEVVEIDVKDQSMVVDFYNVGRVLIKGKQLQQINLGYAITVHKLQGSTIPYVVGCVDFTHYSMLNRQLVYTLMSRAKYELRFVFETNALVKAIATNKVSTKRTFLYHFLCGLLD